QNAGLADHTLAVNGRVEGVIGTDLVQQLADSEDLTYRSDEELLAWLEIDERLPGFEVDDAQAPDGVFITRRFENGLNFWGNVLCVRGPYGCAQKRYGSSQSVETVSNTM